MIYFLGGLLGWILIGLLNAEIATQIAEYKSGGIYARLEDLDYDRKKLKYVKKHAGSEENLKIMFFCLSVVTWPYLLFYKLYSIFT